MHNQLVKYEDLKPIKARISTLNRYEPTHPYQRSLV
jgi:hypothetical protein